MFNAVITWRPLATVIDILHGPAPQNTVADGLILMKENIGVFVDAEPGPAILLKLILWVEAESFLDRTDACAPVRFANFVHETVQLLPRVGSAGKKHRFVSRRTELCARQN